MPNFRGAGDLFTQAFFTLMKDKQRREAEQREAQRRQKELQQTMRYETERERIKREQELADIKSGREFERETQERGWKRGDILAEQESTEAQRLIDEEYEYLKQYSLQKGYKLPEPPGGKPTKAWLKYAGRGLDDYLEEINAEGEMEEYQRKYDIQHPQKVPTDTNEIENILRGEWETITRTAGITGQGRSFETIEQEFANMMRDPYIMSLWDTLADQNPEAYERLNREFLAVLGRVRQMRKSKVNLQPTPPRPPISQQRYGSVLPYTGADTLKTYPQAW